MRKRVLFMLTILLASCGVEDSSTHNWEESKSDRAQSMLFFSGMYSLDEGRANFYDCVTGRDCWINPDNLVAEKMMTAYQKLGYESQQQIYTTIRGYVEKDGEIVVNEFLGFSEGLTCENSPKMSMVYISNSDTLTLNDDYSYVLKVASKGDSRGVWGRNYSNQGFLLSDTLYSVQFIINFEPENSLNSPALIFKRLDGERDILLPLK